MAGTPLNFNQAFNSGGLSVKSSPQMTGPMYTPPTPKNTGPSMVDIILGQLKTIPGVDNSNANSYRAAGGQGDVPVGWNGAGQTNAAQSAADAALRSANTSYDYNAQQLNDQLGSLGGQKQNAINELDTGLSGVRTQVDTSRTNAQTNNDQQVQQAGSIAHSTQQQNRNVLRSLGILNSSAAGELLSKPINEFDKQRAGMQTALTQRFGELDDFLNQKVAEANNAKNSIISQFTDLAGKIQTDLRFNERQRIDAVNQANAALQQRLADIQNSVLSYQQQVNTQKQSYTSGLSQINSYQNPTIGTNYQQNNLLTTPQNQISTVGLTPGQLTDEQRRKQGLLGSGQ